MSISSTLVTDDWRFLDMGDAGQTTASMIKRGLSGTATFTPVGLTGVSVDDEPDWYIVARPRTGNYTLGRLVGQDGAQGVRLVSEVNGHAVVYRVERALRWNGQLVPGVDPVHVVLSGETIHLPDTTLVDGGGADFGQALVTVEEFIERARTAAVRAEAAADAVGEVDAAAREAVRVAAESATAAETSAADSAASAVRAEAGADRVGSAEVVLDARDRATAAATTATGAAATATEQADRATTEADRAGSEADRATEQATAAAGSADAARADAVATGADRVKTTADATATAADRVATAADRTATGQARSQTWASADKAAGSATTATTQADRAESEADRASAAADLADGAAVQAVTERVDVLLAGAPEAYDTLSEIAEKLADQDDVASAMTAQIGQKADTTDAYGKTVARYESGSSQWIEVGDNGYNGGDYMSGGALNLRSADSRYASKTDLATVKATAEAALPASMLQVVDAAPDDPTTGVFYFVRE